MSLCLSWQDLKVSVVAREEGGTQCRPHYTDNYSRRKSRSADSPGSSSPDYDAAWLSCLDRLTPTIQSKATNIMIRLSNPVTIREPDSDVVFLYCTALSGCHNTPKVRCNKSLEYIIFSPGCLAFQFSITILIFFCHNLAFTHYKTKTTTLSCTLYIFAYFSF